MLVTKQNFFLLKFLNLCIFVPCCLPLPGSADNFPPVRGLTGALFVPDSHSPGSLCFPLTSSIATRALRCYGCYGRGKPPDIFTLFFCRGMPSNQCPSATEGGIRISLKIRLRNCEKLRKNSKLRKIFSWTDRSDIATELQKLQKWRSTLLFDLKYIKSNLWAWSPKCSLRKIHTAREDESGPDLTPKVEIGSESTKLSAGDISQSLKFQITSLKCPFQTMWKWRWH